ncbi:hypothetical protein BDV18DRAFT_157054 [Aspergillus unguis]
MTSRTNANAARDQASSFTEQFNQNADYTRHQQPSQFDDTTGMGQPIGTEAEGENVAKVQSDAQARGPTMTTSSENTFGGEYGSKLPGEGDMAGVGSAAGGQRASEAQTSIDSTNAGVDHRRTSYSFTAATLAHANDRFGPEE